MSQAEIGNLRARLGIDTAEFAAGAVQAISQLNSLQGAFKSFAKAVVGGLSFGAVAASIQMSVNHMDELGKSAQKIGVPVEELSKLEYAAKLSDVSLEDLSGSLAKFSKGLAEIAGGGTNSAGGALKAIGVSAVDAQGKLRPTSDIIKDVADQFANMRDGAGKTALAIALFGKSGAQMIPLLNGGSQALKDAGDQLARFGGVITQDAADAAERYNDNLTKMTAFVDGLRNQLTIGLLPTMVNVTDALVTFAEKSNLAKEAGGFFDAVMKQVAVTMATTYQEIFAVSQIIGVMAENYANPSGFADASARWQAAFGRIEDQAAITQQAIGRINSDGALSGSSASIDKLVKSWEDLNDKTKADAPIVPNLEKAKKAAADAAAALKKLQDEGKKVFDDTRTPMEAYAAEVARLKTLLDGNVISTDTYGRALQKLKADLFAADAGFQQLGTDFLTVSQAMAVDAQETIGKVGEALADNFETAFAGIIQGTTSVKDAFSAMAQSISQQLAQLAAQLVKSSILKLLGIALGGIGGGGGAGVNILGMTFGGLYADGGHLGAGKWGIAGEAGPEVIKGPATVTPMDKMQGGGGSLNVTVNNNSSAQVSTRQRADGGLEIDIIEKELAARVARGGSPLSAGIEKGYNVKRAGR